MPEKSGFQIFLAHAREDKPRVRELYWQLQEAGYRPWLDEEDLMPGQFWREEIPKAIKESDLFVACLSEQAIVKRGYVQREFKLALTQCIEMPPGAIYVIPLKFDDCEIPDLRQEEYGIALRDIQWLDYWKSDGFQRLVRVIEFKAKQKGIGGVSPPSDRPSAPQPESTGSAVGSTGNQGKQGNVSGTVGGNQIYIEQAFFSSDRVEKPAEQPEESRFPKLEKLLASGKWREADEETFRIMIRTVGKEEGQYFDLEDLKNFPCEELWELDRLWVKYSEGAWGFSVQKRVWQECGSPTDFGGWTKFCDRVEWRQGGNWVSHNNLQIKTKPKHAAQLPSRWVWFGRRWWVNGGFVCGVSLLSRSEL